MIKDLDLTLKALLSGEAESGSELAQANISFSAPDEEWRRKGKELDLDIYLYDIRENRELRSNEPHLQRNPDGTITQEKPLPRMDCAFLITAWNKVAVSHDEDRELQEHRLLNQVLQVLFRNPRIPPEYLYGSLKAQEPALPMITAQKDGLPDPVEFWNAMGSPLKPAINCVVTFSLDLDQQTTGPMVVAKITGYMHKGKPGTPEKVIQVGGRVLDASDPVKGIHNAWVKIKELHKETITGSDGYYMFTGLAPGEFTFEVGAYGYRSEQVSLAVPSANISDYIIRLKKDKSSEIPIENIPGLTDKFAARLKEEGIDTIGKLLALSTTELAAILKKSGKGSLNYYETKAASILEAAKDLVKS
jgi:hypothetical protein